MSLKNFLFPSFHLKLTAQVYKAGAHTLAASKNAQHNADLQHATKDKNIKTQVKILLSVAVLLPSLPLFFSFFLSSSASKSKGLHGKNSVKSSPE